MTKPLHDSESALRGPHLVSWMLLAAAAGSVNATAFLACERFVAHVTGTITRIGIDTGLWFLMFEYTLVLASFVLGAMASALLVRGLSGVSRFSFPLWLTAGLLLVVAALGQLGAFGPFGGAIEQADDFALLTLLSFAMGLQNATVASATALGLRTTHMTGPASDLGVHLGTALTSTGATRSSALRLAAVRGGKLCAFIGGAALAVALARQLEFVAFAAPAALIVTAITLSFSSVQRRDNDEQASHFSRTSARATS